MPSPFLLKVILGVVFLLSTALLAKEGSIFPLSPENTEEMNYVDLNVQGKIPHWINGILIRNGPGILRGKNGPVKHWFDGLAKLHAFSINQGSVKYTCKFIQSDAYKEYEKTKDFDFNGFAERAKKEQFSTFDFFLGTKNIIINNANVNVAQINKKFVALTEVPLPVEFDKDLNTLGYLDYSDNLPKNYILESAHVLPDPDTQATWNYLIDIGIFGSTYQIYNIPNNSSERKPIGKIPVSSISYMHSFSLAGRYFVLVDYPFRSKKPTDLAYSFIKSFSWDEKEPTIIHLIDKITGEYQSFQTRSLFSLHHVNGFEKDGKITVDLIAYPSADVLEQVNNYPFEKNVNNRLVRIQMGLSSKKIDVATLSNEHYEFPRINNSLIGKPYQYFYAVHFKETGNGLIKYDHYTQSHLYWFETNCYANEPVFIAHPNSKSEDDGVIVSVVNNLETKKSFLLILKGKDFKEIARVETPHLIPFGFHGQFFHTEASH